MALLRLDMALLRVNMALLIKCMRCYLMLGSQSRHTRG